MSKRLILILALAFVVGITAAAFAEVQNVKVSGDITVLGIARNQFGMNAKAGLKNEDAMASITRVKIDADLTDNVIATVRLLNERYWGAEAGTAENNAASSVNSDISLDLAYATLKEFLYSPLTLMVGRQELHFGNDMIIGDVDTNNAASTASPFGAATKDADLSARKSFDAIRATLNYDPLVIDAVLAKTHENALKNNDDVNLYGVNANYKVNKKTTAEAYFWVKDTAKKNITAASVEAKSDKIYVPGGRVVITPMENVTWQGEFAYQFGKNINTSTGAAVKRRAWGAETALTLGMPKVKYTPMVTGLYAYFTGQKENSTKTISAWDSMFENQKYGDIANALFAQTNAHIVGGIVSAKPTEDVTLSGEYYAFWWDKKYGDAQGVLDARGDTVTMDHKKFVGSELDLKAVYDYTEDVQLAIMGGMFFPASGAINKSNNNMASEVVGSMKVTF